MYNFNKILLFLVPLCLLVLVVVEARPKLDGARQEVFLDKNENYLFGWEVNHERKEVIFDVTVKTEGFVGFGLNSKGFMRGADIVIGGFKDGEAYFQDYHGIGNQFPIQDEESNWELLDASEKDGKTFLKFKRLFETCDDQDVTIKSDLIHVIWSYGETDEIKQHEYRGSRQFNLLDPPALEDDLDKYPKWTIQQNYTMTKQDTAYHCTFHKSPDFGGKKHFIGAKTILTSDDAILHVHHYNIFLCSGENIEQILQPYIEGPGYDCETLDIQMLRTRCTDLIYIWAVGGKDVIFPDHVGLPIGERGPFEYAVVETHYDDPSGIAEYDIDWSFELIYDEPTRDHDGGILVTQFLNQPSHIVPPHAQEYTLVAQCTSECTSMTLPKDGINIIIGGFHAHLLGIKMKARHYRDGHEIPWMLSDDNFDFDYQQARLFHDEVKLLPGDHLSVECTYNSDRENGTMFGISTTDEMCLSLMVYYPRTDLKYCSSQYAGQEKIWNEFGIEALNQTGVYKYNPLVTEPEELYGMLYKDAINRNESIWTEELRQRLEEELRYGEHDHSCFVANLTHQHQHWLKARYPQVDNIYEPQKPECPLEDSTTPTPTETTPNPNPTETTPNPNPTETTPNPNPTETTPNPTETTLNPNPTETTPNTALPLFATNYILIISIFAQFIFLSCA